MRKASTAGHAGYMHAIGKSTSSIIGGVAFLGKYYRCSTDWIKPSIDKILDPLAMVVGANAALSILIYYAHKGILQSAFFTTFDWKVYSFIERYDWIEFIIKTFGYTLIYGLANISVIIPAAVRFFRRTSVPSWKNHLKSWAIIATVVIVWTRCGAQHDFDQIRWRIKTADGFFETIGAVFNITNFKTIDEYMSGAKGTQIAADAWQIFGRDSDKSIAEEVQRECVRIRQRNITIGSDIANDAQLLIKQGIIDQPEQLVYITRVVYFEGAYDPMARDLEDIKSGLAGIASVMYNRFLFDTQRERNGLPRAFSNEGDNLFDIVFHYAPNNHGGVTWQFSAIPDNTAYFNGDQALTLASGKMNTDRTLLCYDVLMEVLSEKRTDNTEASLFYQNPRYVEFRNRNWKDRGLDDVKKINSHVFFRPSNLAENWRENISG